MKPDEVPAIGTQITWTYHDMHGELSAMVGTVCGVPLWHGWELASGGWASQRQSAKDARSYRVVVRRKRAKSRMWLNLDDIFSMQIGWK